MDDAQLLKEIARGNAQAFEQFYDRHKNPVFQWALSHTLFKEDAEEISQDVFLEVLERAASFRGESKVSTWLYRITLNRAADVYRAQHAKKRLAWLNALRISGPSLPEIPFFENPEWSLEQQELALALRKAIAELPRQQREAFLMAYIDQIPQQEIADILGLKLKALESTLQRAKKALRLRLNPSVPKGKQAPKESASNYDQNKTDIAWNPETQ
jgi:RNA polymerase sigma factor (sigma-70 family)